jgi:hypothetical protein
MKTIVAAILSVEEVHQIMLESDNPKWVSVAKETADSVKEMMTDPKIQSYRELYIKLSDEAFHEHFNENKLVYNPDNDSYYTKKDYKKHFGDIDVDG